MCFAFGQRNNLYINVENDNAVFEARATLAHLLAKTSFRISIQRISVGSLPMKNFILV